MDLGRIFAGHRILGHVTIGFLGSGAWPEASAVGRLAPGMALGLWADFEHEAEQCFGDPANRVKRPVVTTSRNPASPAWAPSASPTSGFAAGAISRPGDREVGQVVRGRERLDDRRLPAHWYASGRGQAGSPPGAAGG
jgi:hypothetical protein